MKNIIRITSLFLFVHSLAYGVDVEFTIEGNVSDPIILNFNKTFSAEIILKSRSSTPMDNWRYSLGTRMETPKEYIIVAEVFV